MRQPLVSSMRFCGLMSRCTIPHCAPRRAENVNNRANVNSGAAASGSRAPFILAECRISHTRGA